jgi:hypothetical protein
MRAVVHLLFIGNEFVTTRNGHIDTTTVRISFLVRVIGLLNGDVAAVDVIAKSFQPGCIIQNESVDLARFFQTPISDFNRQLHNYWTLTRPFLLREAKNVRATRYRILMLDNGIEQRSPSSIQDQASSIQRLQICCSERKWAGNFDGSVLTRSDFTCSTIRSRTSPGKRSTMAAWIDAGAAKDHPSTPLFTIFTI